MTENERTILMALERLEAAAGEPDMHWPPSAVGGMSGSPHATLLQRMVPKGWVTKRRRYADQPRSAWAYRITEKGAQARANHDLTRGVRQKLAGEAQAAAKARLKPNG